MSHRRTQTLDGEDSLPRRVGAAATRQLTGCPPDFIGTGSGRPYKMLA